MTGVGEPWMIFLVFKLYVISMYCFSVKKMTDYIYEKGFVGVRIILPKYKYVLRVHVYWSKKDVY